MCALPICYSLSPALVVRCRATGPYERVVVATELSDCSRAALLSAARLFPGSDLTVVHAFHVPYEAWLKSDDVKDYVRTEAQKGLEAFLAQEDLAPLASRIEPIVDEGETGSVRSEENTSELQSLMRISYAVFCLKKKKKH